MDVEAFSRVKITVEDQEFEGVFLPSEDESIVVIKFDSGYNVGYAKSKVKNIEVLSGPEEKKVVSLPVDQNKELPKIHVIHTGGTIASKVDYATGGVVGQFTPEELVNMFPELQQIVQVDCTLVSNKSSENFRFSHFNETAQAILDVVKKGVNRVIVTSGTDFLHYFASALSFMLKDVPVGVLVIGSQRSSDRGSADAGMNMICAAQFLAKTNFKGVGVCMHDGTADTKCAILPGTNVRKMHSSVRGAFKAVNSQPWAYVNYPSLDLDLKAMLPMCEGDVPNELPLFNEQLKVGMVYSHPQFYAEEFSSYDTFDGMVLVGSGFGHFPISDFEENKPVLDAIKNLASKIPVAMSVQTISGRVNLQVYSPGRALLEAGVLGQQSSMIPETTFIKLAWLLSNHNDQVRELMGKDLVGELPKTSMDDFFGEAQ